VLKSTVHPYYTVNGQDFFVRIFGCHFHFNGKETDNETQTQDYGYRIYDNRLSRFLSVDPLTKEYPELTPYQFANNKPIESIDLDGLEDWSSKNARQALDQQGKPLVGPISAKVVAANQVHLYTDFQKKLNKLPQKIDTKDDHIKKATTFMLNRAVKDVKPVAEKTKMLGLGVAAIGTLTLQPEIVLVGLTTFKAGDNLANAGTLAEISSEAVGGNGKIALAKSAGFILSQSFSLGIDKLPVGDKLIKTITKETTGKTVDKGQEIFEKSISQDKK